MKMRGEKGKAGWEKREWEEQGFFIFQERYSTWTKTSVSNIVIAAGKSCIVVEPNECWYTAKSCFWNTR